MCVWCCFLSKGKIVRVLDVCLCLWVIWVAGSSLHYSWLEALTHAEEDSAGIQVYVIILKEYKDVLYRKLFSLILAETCVFCSQKKNVLYYHVVHMAFYIWTLQLVWPTVG